ncbi:MAG: flagellar M-ring protein FliF [Planctomycetes bacterium RBG_13_44_8b]|nr:MAG: flagellar M-ring protein FliF [Planctomycetes bacterium RBG_13_44_8b]
MSFFQKISLIWQKVSLVQRALLIAIVLTFIIVSVLLVQWARKPNMKMLYQSLLPEEAAKITDKISEKNIPYELRSGGTAIYVPEEQVYQLRLDMAKEGLTIGQQSGYKIFDDEKIGVSPFVQNVNLKRALQEELAKSIQMIDGVVHARVHIVSPESSMGIIFASEAGKTTASVVLRLRPGYSLSASNVAAITNLIAGSVEGLVSENVTIVDSQGRLLSNKSDSAVANGAGTVADYKERVEQSLAKKVEDMLTAVLGPGRAAVRVSAAIDMNSVNTMVESYDPSAKVASKEEITTKSETEQSGAPAGGGTAAPGSTKKDETIITEYEVGKTVKQEVVMPGKIKSLSVAAFVDLSISDANEAGSSDAAASGQMIMPLSDVEEIIRNALGLKQTDLLKVVHVKFHRPVELTIEDKISNWPTYMAIARHLSLGIMAICALLVLRIFRSARKKAALKAESQLASGGFEGEGTAGLLPAGEATSDVLVMRRQISNALQNNPDRVKQLFSSWLEEKE